MDTEQFDYDGFFAPFEPWSDVLGLYLMGHTSGPLKRAGITNIRDLASMPLNGDIEGLGKNGWRELALNFARILVDTAGNKDKAEKWDQLTALLSSNVELTGRQNAQHFGGPC